MKICTNVKSGTITMNHNQSRKLVIRTGVKSGKIAMNHCQSRA